MKQQEAEVLGAMQALTQAISNFRNGQPLDRNTVKYLLTQLVMFRMTFKEESPFLEQSFNINFCEPDMEDCFITYAELITITNSLLLVTEGYEETVS